MTTTVSATGQINVAPPTVCDASFPSAVMTLPISVPQMGMAAEFHASKSVNASAFAVLDGIGALGIVTQVTFFYFKCASPMQVRLTQTPDTGPDVLAIEYVQGIFIKQAPVGNPITKVEVLGSGTVEYLAAGNL